MEVSRGLKVGASHSKSSFTKFGVVGILLLEI